MDKLLVFASLAVFACAVSASAAETKDQAPKSPLDFKMKSIDGKEVDLAKYKGKVVLIVNTASKCGLTPQYEALERLHEQYGEEGLAILGFPANEFGKQEPGTNKEIAQFCKDRFGIGFDMFEKIVVKGEGINPLYAFLTSEDTNPKFAGEISWNFEKFVVGRDGQVVARFKPRTEPEAKEVLELIRAELKKEPPAEKEKN
jgi:glutathione peroxidase